MKLPEIANRLRVLAQRHGINELSMLADEMRRRPAVRRAPRKARPMDQRVARAIAAYAHANPDESLAGIAQVFNVNPGRVSEVLAGKRT